MISFRYMKILISLPDTLNDKMVAYCTVHDYERSEFIRQLIREKLEPDKWAPTMEKGFPQNIPLETGTSPQKNEGTTPLDVEVKPISIVRSIKNEPEALWEDYNLMPVYKTGVPDQYCVTWHSKGERRTVYPIKKIRPDGSVELEGNYCKECIKEFLAKDGHLE